MPNGKIAIGDEIIAVQGKRVSTSEQLVEMIEDHKIGEVRPRNSNSADNFKRPKNCEDTCNCDDNFYRIHGNDENYHL